MKKMSILFIAALFLAAGLGIARPAQAQGVTWQLVNPLGGFEVTSVHAPRLDTLEGKMICAISNNDWQSPRVLPAVMEGLQAQYPTATFVPYTEFPQGTTEIDDDAMAQRLKDRGCEAVIVGNAA